MGAQMCSAVCVDLHCDNVTVDDSFCNPFTRPELEESSGVEPCVDAGWITGNWSRVWLPAQCCSLSCEFACLYAVVHRPVSG